jgi:hypothetical protein
MLLELKIISGIPDLASPSFETGPISMNSKPRSFRLLMHFPELSIPGANPIG